MPTKVRELKESNRQKPSAYVIFLNEKAAFLGIAIHPDDQDVTLFIFLGTATLNFENIRRWWPQSSEKSNERSPGRCSEFHLRTSLVEQRSLKVKLHQN
jgi:hypothetical protein